MIDYQDYDRIDGLSGETVDLFAMSNPVLCGLILWAFSKGYTNITKCGYNYPLLYLPIPFVLSKSISTTLKGTNKKTGLFEWLSRNPDIPLYIQDIVLNTRNITIDAISISLRHQLITIDQNNNVTPGIKKLTHAINPKSEIQVLLKNSVLFGTWMGQINSTRLVLQSLGIKL